MLEVHGAETDGRATRWESHKAQRRTEVLDAAVAVIEEDGLDISVKQIAERVGLPRPVVYRHFKDRADLDEQIRRHVVEMLMIELAPALRPDGTVREAIRRAVDTYLGWIDRHPQLHAFLGKRRNRPAGRSRVVAGTKTAIAVDVSKLFEAGLRRFGLRTESAASLAFGLVGFVDATVNRWLADPDRALTSAELADFLGTSIWGVLDANLRAGEVSLDPETPVRDLLAQ